MAITTNSIYLTDILDRESFDPSERVVLSGLVLADHLEKQLAHYYSRGVASRSLLLDFAQAEFIDMAALVNCVATVVDRTEKQLVTKIGLPKGKRVRDFLSVWRFLEALSSATGRSSSDLFVPDDLPLLEEPQTTHNGIGSALDLLEFDPDWAPNSRGPTRNFFEFLTFTHPSGDTIQPDANFAAIPRQVSKRWVGPLIQQVLRRHFGDDSPRDDIARVVVYEAVGNAVRHPEARLIQIVSKFDLKSPSSYRNALGSTPESKSGSYPKTEGSLRICIWDDGKPIAETLLPLVRKGDLVRTVALPPYMSERIHVLIRRFDKKLVRAIVVDQNEDLTVEKATEAHCLLASLYPGVSRSVAQQVPDVEDYDDHRAMYPQQLYSGAPGMGLYALTRTVLDQFQGQLLIRSGRCRLLMEVAHDAYRRQHNVRYKAKITWYPKAVPPFRGNLLVIQLPIRQTL